MTMPLVGALEAGGTKCVCAIGRGPADLQAITRIATTTPDETLAAVNAYFTGQMAGGTAIEAVGIACFGPVDLSPGSNHWGHVTATPKAGWQNIDVAGPIARATVLPVAFDTDVNGAALAEARWGAGQGADPVIYVTVGTGIGGGAVVNGRPVHGLVHTEMGHIRVQRHRDDAFPGRCPWHGDCLEGLACGPALIDRWGDDVADLPPDHPAWAMQADYLGQLCATLILICSPQRLILGGGVMAQTHLYDAVRSRTRELLAGYVAHPLAADRIAQLIVAPGLGERAGLLGALALAQDRLAAGDEANA